MELLSQNMYTPKKLEMSSSLIGLRPELFMSPLNMFNLLLSSHARVELKRTNLPFYLQGLFIFLVCF